MSTQSKKYRSDEQEAAYFLAGLSATGVAKEAINEAVVCKESGVGVEEHIPKKRRFPPRIEDTSACTVAPYPFFSYTDHSRDQDIDRLALLEEVDHVPSFPVKMFVILSDPDLKSIVSWDDHGRSFKILKPREFESTVLPCYFDHASLPSFQRQVNGWGFRRLTEGEYRNSYYEEHFLRSLPWLCKKMRRPRVGEKKKTRVEHEPDLAAISAMYPLPNNVIAREIEVILAAIKSKGPKAKVPSNWTVEKATTDPSNPSSLVLRREEDSNQADVQLASMNIPVNNARFHLTAAPAPTQLDASNLQALTTLIQQIKTGTLNQNAHQCSSLSLAPDPSLTIARSNENQLLAGVLAALQSHNISMMKNLVNSLSNQNVGPCDGNALQALLPSSQNGPTDHIALRGQCANGRFASSNTNTATPTMENVRTLLLANHPESNLNPAIVMPPAGPNQLPVSLQPQGLLNQTNPNPTGPCLIDIDNRINPNQLFSGVVGNSFGGDNTVNNSSQILAQILQVIHGNGNSTPNQVNSLFQKK